MVKINWYVLLFMFFVLSQLHVSGQNSGTQFSTSKGILNDSIEPKSDLLIDFSNPIGKIKPLHGVNGGPFRYGDHQAPIEKYHADAGFSSTRLHDANWPHPDAVDINTIFPIFSLDADDPGNYNFEKTDDYIAPIVKNKSEIIYRLGVSIEHFTHYYIHPPKDYDKWAKICVNIIRHYNDGWNNGFHYNIKHWEIWNENNISRMWTGNPEEFFRFYETVAKAIKAYNPSLMAGGPAAAGVQPQHNPQIKLFLEYCRDHKVPLDFFSWHRYSNNPEDIVTDAQLARTLLDEYGFKSTESFIDEWHYITTWSALGTTLGTKDTVDYSTVREAFAATVGVEGAVFAASILMLLQDSPIDMANFYCADYSPWSMFDEYGVPSKVYFAFKAFNQMSKMSKRVSCEKLSNDNTLVVIAGISEDRKDAAILMSNSSPDNKSYTIDLQNFIGDDGTHVEIYHLDKTRNLEPEKASTLKVSETKLMLELPSTSLCLVKLSRL